MLFSVGCNCPKCRPDLVFGKPYDDKKTWEKQRPKLVTHKPGSHRQPDQTVPIHSRSKKQYEPDGILHLISFQTNASVRIPSQFHFLAFLIQL